MSSFVERIQDLWNSAKTGRAKTRARFQINRDHVQSHEQLGPPFEKEKYYFQIIINEMFLANSREWWTYYDPMAFIVSSYIYDKKLETQPTVVGPDILKQFEQEVPFGMIYQDTPVTSLNPYQGGALTLTVIFNKIQRQNNADTLLRVVESVSSVISPTLLSSAYTKMAETVIDGVETILGLSQTQPILGYRISINPDIHQKLEPTYFALIDMDEGDVSPEQFWVRDNRLYYGDQADDAEPYRENDFILFSIAQGDKRTDERTLPFYPIWETAQELAARPELHYWNEAKANFNTLKRRLLNSPDLTKPDSTRLRTEYLQELMTRRSEAVDEGNLSAGQGLPQEEIELRKIAQELDALDNF